MHAIALKCLLAAALVSDVASFVPKTFSPTYSYSSPYTQSSPLRVARWNEDTNNGDTQTQRNEFGGIGDVVKGARDSMQRATSTVLLSAVLFVTLAAVPNKNIADFSVLGTPPASAADYGSLSEEQKTVAEAWRIVDNFFIDRTFNNQDWFKLRQDVVKPKYKSMDQAHVAIEKMVASLGDKYTRYLPPAKYESIVNSATGTLFGVGVEIASNKDGMITAADVEANSPAFKGGVKAGDIFIEVDGTRFDDGKGTPDDVAVKVRGPEGSKVGVVMQRDGKTLDFILTRAPIKVTSVKNYVSESSAGKVGVIRIKSFSGTTATSVSDAVKELKTKGAKNFVLDVRGNPGGLLPGGVDTAALFLDADKPVVFVVNKKGEVDAQSTFSKGLDLESPLVILVDGNTASAAEVMTAALKENGRATIVGEKTFGKGIVQTIRALSNNQGGVAVTLARYETPKHNDINKQGIPVDVSAPIDCPKDDAIKCVPNSAFKPPSA